MSVRQYDANGWFEITDTPLSRAGVFPYTARSIQAPGWEQEPDRIYQVYRPEEELSRPETVASAKLLPWTDEHEMLGDPDAAEGLTPPEQKGVHGTIGERVYFKDGVLYGNIKLWSKNLAAMVAAGKKELSCGFRCVYEMGHGDYRGQPYDAIQRQMLFNHLASVFEGRMGRKFAVYDGAAYDSAIISLDTSGGTMKVKIKRRDRLARNFGLDTACAAALLPGAAMDAEVEEDSEGGTKAVTLEDVVSMVGALAPQLAKIGEIQTALSKMQAAGATDTDDPNADMEPVLDSAGKTAMDSATGKPIMRPKAKKPGAGMDAAEVTSLRTQIAQLNEKVGAIAAPTMPALMREISTRNALAARLADHTGAFDHAEMTTAEVAKYGCDKLGLKPAAGAEVSAVEAYLVGRTPARQAQVFGVVAGADGAVKNVVADYQAGKNKAAG